MVTSHNSGASALKCIIFEPMDGLSSVCLVWKFKQSFKVIPYILNVVHDKLIWLYKMSDSFYFVYLFIFFCEVIKPVKMCGCIVFD